MKKKRWLLLKAVEHNWSMIGSGDWMKTKWLIFSDGSYKIVKTYNGMLLLSPDDKPHDVEKNGRMGIIAFVKLRKALKHSQWRYPFPDETICDGVAWEMESYKEDGSIDKTSEGIGYIYFQPVLQAIASLLPSDRDLF